MFHKLKSRTTKKRSTLDKQRVKKGAEHAQIAFGLSWSAAAKGLVLIFLLTLIWGLGLRVADKFHDVTGYINSSLVLAPKEWRIDVVSNNGTPLPEDIKRDVFAVAAKQLRLGSPAELRSLARQVEALGVLDGVKVIRPLANTVVFSAEMRQPALLVAVGGKTRYLTLDGTIFGDASATGENSTWPRPSVLVTGIFDPASNPAFDASMKLILTAEHSRHLAEAMDVWEQSLAAHVEVKIVDFQKFRGFAIYTPDNTEIVIGVKPFDYKLKKLRGILDGLKRDGALASRIELDYDGKAFVKEKKL